MIPIRYKDLLYDGIRLASLLNTQRWRLLLKLRPPKQPVKLNVGCGPRKVPGFVNIDINPLQRPDVWLDIRNGLPYPTGTVSCIVSSHTLEHFYSDDVQRILRDWHRALMPGGHVRIVVPCLELAIQAYTENDYQFFHYLDGESIGRRFVEYILWHGQHKVMFDYGYLSELLREAGFQDIRRQSYLESSFLSSEELQDLDPVQPRHVSLYVEAVR